jgi:hypothetical protein
MLANRLWGSPRQAVAALSLGDARARLLVLIFGGLAVFYSSSGVSPLKALYLVCLPVIAVRSALSIGVLRGAGERDRVRDRVSAATVLMALPIAISLPVALLNHTPASLWIRDAVPYLLITISPLVALDLSRNVSPLFLSRTLVGSGLVATVSFAVWNIHVRHLASLPFGALLYPSLLLPFALFSYACARMLFCVGRDTWLWGLVAFVVLVSVVGTGTRLGLVLLAAPVVMLFGRGGMRRALRTLALVITAAAVIAFVLGVLAPVVGISTAVVSERIKLTESAIAHPTRDGSIKARFSEGSAAWRLFIGAPALGDGPGHLYTQYFPGSGQNSNRFTLDTSVTVLSKFGVLGGACFVAAFALMALCVRQGGTRDASLALLGLAVITLISLPISNPFEDKGFAYGLVLLLGLAWQRDERASQLVPRETASESTTVTA